MGLGSCKIGFGVWGLGFGFWVLGFGVWCLGFGVWCLEFNSRLDSNKEEEERTVGREPLGNQPSRERRHLFVSCSLFFFFIALKPRVELYKSLWALNTSPPRNRCTFM